MKKFEKNLIIVLTIISLLAILLTGYFGTKKYVNGDPSKLIATSYYSNYAWGYTFSGTAIFEDGSIYTWSVDNEYTVNPNDYDDLSKFILKEAEKSNSVVEYEDLRLMKKRLSLINEESTEFEQENYMYDYGEKSIYVYKNGEKYLLDLYGDWTGTSKDANAQGLIKIIKKYAG